MRQFMAMSAEETTGDPKQDIQNEELIWVNLLANKLRDELVGRLSGLAERKVGRLTFYFASQKLGLFEDEVMDYETFIKQTGIREKRNRDISHKELPEKWSAHKNRFIPYHTLLQATAKAIRIMKLIDRMALGPFAPFLWREARKKRYQLMAPPRAAYMLVPYLNLSTEDRVKILKEEIREGQNVWSQETTDINGTPTPVLACKKWGIIVLGGKLLPLPQYPLINLESIRTKAESAETGDTNA